MSNIRGYGEHKKQGMAREEQIKDKWNDKFNKKGPKKYNVKQRPSFDDDDDMEESEKEIIDFFESINVPDSFSTKSPTVFLKPKEEEDEAKRQPNSGAMWYAKGDISLEHALVEVKERGTVNSRGEKTISIPKLWLDKQAEEAFIEGKEFWYLAFAYKGSDDVYVIKPYDDEIEMVAYIRKLQQENELLREINARFESEEENNE